MRVVHLLPSLDPAQGGPAVAVPQLARAWHDAGHEVGIVTVDAPDAPWSKEAPVPVHALGPGAFKYGYAGALVPWLRARAAALDAVVVHGIWQYHALAAWRALAGRVPYYVYAHGMLDPWFARTYPLKHAKKYLYWWLAEHRVLRDAAAVLFTTEQERAEAERSFRPYAVRARVVPLGTAGPDGHPTADRDAFRAAAPSLGDRRFLLFLGRIAEKKGADMLMRAFARRGDRGLALVMAGPDHGARPALEALARELAIDQDVVWTGMLRGASKWGALRSADAFVLPSHQENFGVAVVEALAVGTPVLISDRVGIHREVRSAGAGLVAPDTQAGTDSLLERFGALTAGEWSAMGERGRALFAQRYEIASAARALVELMRADR